MISVSMITTSTLSGCVSTTSSPGFNVGPQLSSLIDKVSNKDYSQEPDRPKLDVIIPVFDPGLSDDPEKNAKDGAWPELRRAEANRFALKLKDALEETGQFGAIRVTPDASATGDIYIMGKIAQSDGENVEIDLVVRDISGAEWMDSSFDHEVPSDFHTNLRNKGKDPYDPVFKLAATDIVEELSSRKKEYLEQTQNLTALRFGASFSDDAFAQYMTIDNGKAQLVSMPSEDDPMLRRTKAIRVRDQLFVDRLQTHYQAFSVGMNDSYAMWQEQSQLEVRAEREAKRKATGEAVAGILLLGLAVAAAAAGGRSDNYGNQTAAVTGAVLAGAGGIHMLGKSFQTSDEAKVHREALNELGQSVDMDLAPQVIEFENKTVELTGDAKEQFAQWRKFLKGVYALESTPNTQL